MNSAYSAASPDRPARRCRVLALSSRAISNRYRMVSSLFGWLSFRSYDDRARPGSTPRTEILPIARLRSGGVSTLPDPAPPGETKPTDAHESDGQLLELEVGAIAAGGGCVARAPDGKVVFVRHTLPGERVRAQVTASDDLLPAGGRRRDPEPVARPRGGPRARTPGPAAAAAATSSTWRSGPSAGSRPSASPSSWSAWPGSSGASRSNRSPVTPTGWAGAAGCASRSTAGAPWGSAATAPTGSSTSTNAPSPARPSPPPAPSRSCGRAPPSWRS